MRIDRAPRLCHGAPMNPYQTFVDWFAGTRLGAKVAKRLATAIDRRLIRWTKGRVTSGVGTSYGKNILLLTTIGAKTGQERTVPLLFTPHGDAVLVVASNAGGDANPAWYNNVRKTPECWTEIGGVKVKRRARELEGDEARRAFEIAAATYGGYTRYQERTERRIPVLSLERID
jgi:deazaflavin-dependent oxidoreductase (nitroreductase family)